MRTQLKNKVKFFLLVLLTLLIAGTAAGQKSNKKITITGSVLDARFFPVPNSIVIVDGQNTSSVTNSGGKYRIRVSAGAKKIGIVSFAHGIIEEDIDGRSRINFMYSNLALMTEPRELPWISAGEEAVNTGYGYTKKKLLTNNIKRLDGRDSKYASYRSIKEMLEREVAGVRIIGGKVIIHGASNMYGLVPALIMVDGVPTDDIDGISPRVVESIEVLKEVMAELY